MGTSSAWRSMGKRIFLACLGAFVTTQVMSQTAYPSQPIRLIVSFAAGGPTDIFARVVASKLEKELGQPIIVENKPGGGSNIGSEFVAKAKPDGYTLLVVRLLTPQTWGSIRILAMTRRETLCRLHKSCHRQAYWL